MLYAFKITIMKKLKSLAEHNTSYSEFHWKLDGNEPCLNGIACPNCNSELYDSSPSITLTSMPPKKSVKCTICKYVGYRVA